MIKMTEFYENFKKSLTEFKTSIDEKPNEFINEPDEED